MRNILLAAVPLRSEAAVRGAPESTCYYMMRKAFKISAGKFIFWLGCSLQACNIDANELVHWYFSVILITLGNFS